MFVKYRNSLLHFIKAGQGPKVLLAFHGFGKDCHNFDLTIPFLEDEFTVYSFDLFFHGESIWNEKDEFTQDQFKQLFNQFFNENNIGEFSLLSYSLGSRWALGLSLFFGYRVQRMCMVAPDGLRWNPVFHLASHGSDYNPLISLFVRTPFVVVGGIKMMSKMGWLDDPMKMFFLNQIDSVPKRKNLINIWRSNKHLLFSRNELKVNFNKTGIQLTLIFGKWDSVIPPTIGKKFSAMVAGSSYHEIDYGHNLLILAKVWHLISKSLKA